MSAFITCPVCKHDLLENHEGQRWSYCWICLCLIDKEKETKEEK